MQHITRAAASAAPAAQLDSAPHTAQPDAPGMQG